MKNDKKRMMEEVMKLAPRDRDIIHFALWSDGAGRKNSKRSR